MRSSILCVPFLLAAAACGDDGGSTPIDSGTIIDSSDIDAPAAACSLMPTYGGLGLGTTTARRAGEFFEVPDMGPNMGKTVFVLAAGLPGSVQNTAEDLLLIEYVKPAGGFTTGTPIPFSTDATSAAVVSATIIGDINRPAMSIGNVYYASSGALNLSAIGEADGNPITGTISATNFREIDAETGAIVAGGCTSMMEGLSFFLTQMAATPPQTGTSPTGMRPYTAAERAELRVLLGHIRR